MSLQLESLDGLDPKLAGLFSEQDGKFSLDPTKIPDAEALEKKRSIEIEHRKNAEKLAAENAAKLEALQKQIDEGKHKKLEDDGDLDALRKSYDEKLSKRESELIGEMEGLKGQLQTILVDNVAISLASEIAIEGSAQILVPHIKQRLAAENRDGSFQTVVMDANGKPSASTLDDLKNEFSEMPAFAPVIVGSKASGSGAGGGGNGGGGSGGTDLSKMTREAKLAHFANKRKT